MNSGLLFAAAAYGLWGIFPLYFRLLQNVPALELVAHRVFWSFLLLAIILTFSQSWKSFRQEFSKPRTILLHLASSLMIGANWLIYVWAVNSNQVVESSMGYFLNPLLTIVLGVLVFHERLRSIQWFSVALAGVGIVVLALVHGRIPWVALSLALTFGLYGLLKKLAPIQATFGLFLETIYLLLPAIAYLAFGLKSGNSAWTSVPISTHLFLVGTGLVTMIPLLLFALACARIPLSQLGFMQYITPTIQFLLGVFLYHEPFLRPMQISFACIWIALALNWIPVRKTRGTLISETI